MKFAKFLKTPYFTEHLQRLLLEVSGFQPATLLKRFRQRYLSVSFGNFLRTSFDRTLPDGCFLSTQEAVIQSCVFESYESWNSVNFWICEFWEVFQITSFIERLWETVYFLYKLDRLSNFNHQVQSNSIRVSQVLFKGFIEVKEVAIRRRSFTYNPWKLSLKKLIYNEVARSRSSHPEVFLRKGVLKKYAANLQENTHAEVQFQ